jgi:hypothetical protein
VSRPAEVTVTRHRDVLEGQRLRVLGRLRRHGGTELLVILPDGSKRMIPQAWTDAAADAGVGGEAAALGMVGDLLAACVLVSGFSARAGEGPEQAARQSPCKEDSRAACPAQSAAGGVSGATPDDFRPAAARAASRGGQPAGQPDRQGGRDGRRR